MGYIVYSAHSFQFVAAAETKQAFEKSQCKVNSQSSVTDLWTGVLGKKAVDQIQNCVIF